MHVPDDAVLESRSAKVGLRRKPRGPEPARSIASRNVTLASLALGTIFFFVYSLVYGLWVGTAVALTWFLLHVVTSFRYIPADPLMVGLVLFLGAPINMIRNAGLRYLPFWGILFKTINFDAVEKNENIVAIKFTTPDDVDGMVDVAFIYGLDMSETPFDADEQDLISSVKRFGLKGIGSIHGLIPLRVFLKVGRHEGVINRLTDKIRRTVIDFMADPVHGPKTFRESRRIDNGIYANLIKRIAGAEILPAVRSSIDTDILMKWFGVEGREFTKNQMERIRRGFFTKDPDTRRSKEREPEDPPKDYPSQLWFRRVVEEQMLKDERDTTYTEEAESEGVSYREQLEDRLVERNTFLEMLSLGEVCVRLPALGVNFLGVEFLDREFDPDIEEAAKKKTLESLQKAGEKVEITWVTEAINKLMKPVSEGGADMTKKEATELVQSERSKVPKTINEHRYVFDEATAKAISSSVEGFIKAFLAKGE